MKSIGSITDILKDFDLFIVDAYGVFYDGNAIVEGSFDTFELLKKNNKKVVILSNATISTEQAEQKYQKHGLCKKHYDCFVTSGQLCKESLTFSLLEKKGIKLKNAKYYLVGEPNPFLFQNEALSKFEQTENCSEADFMYIGMPYRDRDFLENLKKARECKLTALCVNPDIYAFDGNPPQKIIVQGGVAKEYEKLGGKAVYFGKSSIPEVNDMVFNYIIEKAVCKNIKKDRIIMIGDTMHTDVAFAKTNGFSSLLITNGMDICEIIKKDGIKPTYFTKTFGLSRG